MLSLYFFSYPFSGERLFQFPGFKRVITDHLLCLPPAPDLFNRPLPHPFEVNPSSTFDWSVRIPPAQGAASTVALLETFSAPPLFFFVNPLVFRYANVPFLAGRRVGWKAPVSFLLLYLFTLKTVAFSFTGGAHCSFSPLISFSIFSLFLLAPRKIGFLKPGLPRLFVVFFFFVFCLSSLFTSR